MQESRWVRDTRGREKSDEESVYVQRWIWRPKAKDARAMEQQMPPQKKKKGQPLSGTSLILSENDLVTALWICIRDIFSL